MVATENSGRKAQKKFEEVHELKCQILGQGRHHDQEGRHLCWTNKEITIEVDAKHVDQLLRGSGMIECSLVNTPATTGSKYVQGGLLHVVQAKLYRRSAARLLTSAKTDPIYLVHRVFWPLAWQIPHLLTRCDRKGMRDT